MTSCHMTICHIIEGGISCQMETKEKKKLVYFKPGLNKRMFTSLAFVAY